MGFRRLQVQSQRDSTGTFARVGACIGTGRILNWYRISIPWYWYGIVLALYGVVWVCCRNALYGIGFDIGVDICIGKSPMPLSG